MKLKDIFLELAEEYYTQSKGYFWRTQLDTIILYDKDFTKVLSFRGTKDLIIHDTNEEENIKELLELARVEKIFRT